MLFAWLVGTLWPFLKVLGVYFGSVLVLLFVGVASFEGIRARRPGAFLAAGFWFAVARGAFGVLAGLVGLVPWIEGMAWWVYGPLALLGNTFLVIVLDGVIRDFQVRSWWTAISLGALLSLTEWVGRALFVAP